MRLEFRAFLAHAQSVFESKQHVKQWGASAALARRLTAALNDWLARSLFSEIREMRFAHLSSPVLQCKVATGKCSAGGYVSTPRRSNPGKAGRICSEPASAT